MKIWIDDRQDAVKVDDKIYKLLEMAVERSIREEGRDDNVEVSIVLIDNPQIKELNKQYRGIDNETDVLSFPAIDYDEEHNTSEDVNMDSGDLILGDIAISVEKAVQQAAEYGHSFQREIAFLTVHGMFHLLGYDHEDEDEATIMRQKEETVLASLGLFR